MHFVAVVGIVVVLGVGYWWWRPTNVQPMWGRVSRHDDFNSPKIETVPNDEEWSYESPNSATK
jgi:hypothetical protein